MLGETKKYNLGIIASRNFNLDKISYLETVLGSKKDTIAQIFTNDVAEGGRTVIHYCLENKIPFAVYPIQKFKGASLLSNRKIIEQSDFLLIFCDAESTNHALVEQQAKDLDKKFRTIFITPNGN